MEGDWGRCLEMILVDRTGHEMKWTWLMAEMKVDLTGLKSAVYKYWASSRLVMSWRRIPFARFGCEFGGC